jgi:molybdopterin converting factor small subunit
MVHVVMATSDGLELTGGVNAFEVAADTVRRMIVELDERFPGLGMFIDQHMAVAINGEIHQDAWSAVLDPDAEVVLIPKIGGG